MTTTATVTSTEIKDERKCFCPGDCNCRAAEWMMRPRYCGCQQH